MPKYQPLTPDQLAEIKGAGYPNPEEYVLDATTGDYVNKSSITSNPIAEGAKGFGRGLVSSITALPEVAGHIADAIREKTGDVSGFNVTGKKESALVTGAKAVEKLANQSELLAPGINDPYFSGTIGQGLGGLLGTILTGGGTAAVGKKLIKDLAPEAVKNLVKRGVITSGALGAGNATVNRELERQEQAGEAPSQGKAVGKGAVVGGASALIGNYLGPGRWFGEGAELAPTTLKELGSRAVPNFGLGAVGGAGQNALEQALVNGNVDPGEVLKAGGISGAVQTLGGAAIDAAGYPAAARAVKQAKEAEVPIATEPVNAPEAPYKLADTKKQAMLAQYGKGEEYAGALSTPVDKAANTLFKLGVPVDGPMLDTLAATWGGKEGNIKTLDKVVDEIADRHIAQAPAEPVPQHEVVKDKLAVGTELLKAKQQVEAYNSALNNLRTKMAKKSPGDAWLDQDMEQMRILEGLLTQAREHVNNFSRTLNMGEKTGPAFEGGNAGEVMNPFEASGPAGAPVGEAPLGLGGTLAEPLLPDVVRGEGPVETGDTFSGDPNVGLRSVPTEPTSGIPLSDWLQQTPNFKRSVKAKIADVIKQEGEQGHPFAETPPELSIPGKQEVARAELGTVAEPPKLDPKITKVYSGLPTEDLMKYAQKAGLLLDRGIVNGIGAVVTQLARRNPEAALLASKAPELFKRRYQLQNEVVMPLGERLKMVDLAGKQLNPAREKLLDPRILEWLHKKTDTESWDTSDLPEGLRETGEFIKNTILLPHQRQREAGVGVERRDSAGNRTVTEPRDLEGYFPWSIDEKAFEAKREGGAAWEPYRQAWLDSWQQHNRTDNTPNWQVHAENALNEIFATAFDSKTVSGQPLFSAVRKAHGIPLPRKFRSDDIVNALQRYADKYSADVAYGEVIQKNPAMRKVLGLTEDPMGIDTTATDPVTWRQVPDAWKAAVLAGKEAGAEWSRNADPNNPPDTNIGTLGADENTNMFMHSYRQVPLATVGRKAQQTWNALVQGAGSLVMQSVAGFRDAATAVVNTYTRAGLENTIKGVMDVVRPGGFSKALKAGAMQYDPLLGQMPSGSLDQGVNWFNRALVQSARAIRTGTGRQAADQFSRALGYNTGYEAVMAGKGKELIKMFGPPNPEGMTKEQIADHVGGRLATAVGNPSDVRNLPAYMVPQANTLVGNLLALSRFPIAQFNNFHSSVVRPALNGNIKPLVRAFVGATVGGAMVNGITQALTNSKPQNLTWGEWLKLPNDEQKLKELFYTWLGYDRAIGSVGILSDLLYPIAAKEAGAKNRPVGFEPQNAGWIVLSDMTEKLQGFNNSLTKSWTSPKDLMELGYELSKSAQVLRGLANWTEDKPAFRDRATFERLTGKSAATGKPLGPQETPASKAPVNPFSLEKEIWKAESESDWKKLQPALIEIVKAKGIDGLPKLSKWRQSNEYYLWLRDNQGAAEATRQFQMDLTKDAEAEWREKKLLEVLTKK